MSYQANPLSMIQFHNPGLKQLNINKRFGGKKIFLENSLKWEDRNK